MKKEESLQLQICNYLRLQYPSVLWACDLSSGLKLTMGQAAKAKRMREARGYPDLCIFKANNKHHGLVIELKKEGTKLLKKDGTFVDEHIKEQWEVLMRFMGAGYYASFGIGFDNTKQIIDSYLNNKL